MSHKKTRSNPFVMIPKTTIYSDKFQRLTNSARVALILLKCQCCRSGQTEVRFPYSDAEKFMDRHTWSAAIKKLTEEGFVKKSQEGGLFRRTNVYELTE